MKAFICALILSLFCANVSSAKVYVKTSAELKSLLAQDKDLGQIYLTSPLYELENLSVKAGGVLLPAKGVKPILMGNNYVVRKDYSAPAESGRWKALIPQFERCDFFALDSGFNALPIASKVDGFDVITLREKDIVLLGGERNRVKIPIGNEFPSLKNRSSSELKNCILKLSCWYICMDVESLYSDSKYLYGDIKSKLYYSHLHNHPKNPVYLRFFNYPFAEDGIYIDGDNYVHVLDSLDSVRICFSKRILNLTGDRDITFDGISFMGTSNAVRINKGSCKHFSNCFFYNCGTGIVCNRGETNLPGNNSVEGCSFYNLYNNVAVQMVGCDNVKVIGNTISHTGLFNKGGSLIDVSGKNFLVEGNSISDFSYIGIRVGNTRKHDAEVISGKVLGNIIDNIDNYGINANCLRDGGGIYIFTHSDDTEVSGNLVRNIGAEGACERGIYLDDGAYNVKVVNNLVYNIFPGEKCIHARYAWRERSCMNNVFEGNILIGDNIIAGNRKKKGAKSLIKNNYVSGEIDTQGNQYVIQTGTRKIKVSIGLDGKVYIDRSVKINMTKYPKAIKETVNNNVRL